ncbi:hypothetical protein Tco_1138902 [Tanacetum coccineum]
MLKSRDVEVDNLKAQLLLKEAEAAEVVRLRAQVSAFEAAERVHVDELNTLKQKNVALEDEKKSLNGKVAELQSLVSVKDHELKDVDVTVTSLKSQNDGLADQVRELEITCSGLHERLVRYENLTERLGEFQNAEMKVVNERVEKLDADLAEMASANYISYPSLSTYIPAPLEPLGAAIAFIEIRDAGWSSHPTPPLPRTLAHHGRAGKSLADIVAYNPSAEADFNYALQELREVDFPLLAELKSHKDAGIKDVMNLLRLESPLADAPGMDSLQPDIEQLKVSYPQFVLFSLGAAISRSIEKGMQDGLAAGIDHGRAGRSLADIVAYNPSTKVDFNSSLQELREVDFCLLAELKSHKDASIEDVMNLLRLESPLADAPSKDNLQPDVEQLKVPIHRSEDQVVLGETSLSFSLSVSHSRMERIRANIIVERSALLGVWTPLSEPLSVHNLIGAASTSTSIPAATGTTMALSTTFASASSIPPISVEDYEIIHADGQENS